MKLGEAREVRGEEWRGTFAKWIHGTKSQVPRSTQGSQKPLSGAHDFRSGWSELKLERYSKILKS